MPDSVRISGPEFKSECITGCWCFWVPQVQVLLYRNILTICPCMEGKWVPPTPELPTRMLVPVEGYLRLVTKGMERYQQTSTPPKESTINSGSRIDLRGWTTGVCATV